MSRKKIIYVIGTFGHGQGGHFRDLREIASDQSRTADCLILNIGPFRSSVLEETIVRVENIDTNASSFFQTIQKVRKIFVAERPDIINLFDLRVYFFARVLKALSPVPLIITKCGGENPRRFFPASDGLVVFSRENLDYFSALSVRRNGALLFLPNRVTIPTQNEQLIAEIRKSARTGGVDFVLIGRLTRVYESTMLGAIDLVNRLNSEGCECNLFIIGVPEDAGVVEALEYRASKSVILLTDERYTKDAAQLLDLAEISISSGRGLMEAAALGKVLLTTVKGESIQSLVADDTFEELFKTNFSPRNALASSDPEHRYELIASAVRSPELRAEYSRQAFRYFQRYFDVNGVAEKYDKFFDGLRRRRSLSPVSFLWGALAYFRSRSGS